MTRVTGPRMSLKLLAGVRPQSKVECLLGSGPKVKSQATVLWRQTRGAALWDMTRGLRDRRRVNEEERGLASHGAGLAPYSIFVGKEKKQEFVWQIGKFRLSLQLKYNNDNNNIY